MPKFTTLCVSEISLVELFVAGRTLGSCVMLWLPAGIAQIKRGSGVG
ncbi:hypothetical protein [Nonomuraea sp. NEAU-A123]|nr:hypothetical protein [Nonomuraea sp. NEAU-A123]